MNSMNYRCAEHNHRCGTVLLLVLVVVMLLSFSMYSFAELMLVQYEATRSTLTEMQLRQLAESGIVATSDLLDDADRRARLDVSREVSAVRQVQITTVGDSAARYSVLASVPSQRQTAAYGLADESARLNLNGLPLSDDTRGQSIRRLTQIPRLSAPVAAAMMDWMDPDDTVSENGAESSWYSTQRPAYRPRQGRFQSLQELLLVRGVTAQLLFGEDTNQNGVLDPNENDGGDSPPMDNSDGELQLGWSGFLTVCSAESTLRPDGTRKLNVNTDDLLALYDALEVKFGRKVARFVVALRMAGRLDRSESRQKTGPESKVQERMSSAERRLREQLGLSEEDEGGLAALANSRGVPSRLRGGLRIRAKSSFQIASLVDLVGGSVRIDVDRVDTLLPSPWDGTADGLERALAQLSPHVTVTDQPRLAARVNIFQASFEVLMTIPGMSESLARAITHARPRPARTRQLGGEDTRRRPKTIAWLLKQGLLDLKRLREIAPYITTQGDVFRGVAVGHIDGINRRVGIRFLIDATPAEPRLLEIQDLPSVPLRLHGSLPQSSSGSGRRTDF